MAREGAGRGVFYLYEVGVPGILANVEVVVARILPCRLAEDVSWKRGGRRQLTGRHTDSRTSKRNTGAQDSRYFDARTNR